MYPQKVWLIFIFFVFYMYLALETCFFFSVLCFLYLPQLQYSGIVHSCSRLYNIPLCIYYNFCICFPINEYLGYFQLFTTTNNAVMNITVRVSWFFRVYTQQWDCCVANSKSFDHLLFDFFLKARLNSAAGGQRRRLLRAKLSSASFLLSHAFQL